MQKLGKKQLTVQLQAPLETLPDALTGLGLSAPARARRSSTPTTRPANNPASAICSNRLNLAGIGFKDVHTTQSSLEDIFVSLVKDKQ